MNASRQYKGTQEMQTIGKEIFEVFYDIINDEVSINLNDYLGFKINKKSLDFYSSFRQIDLIDAMMNYGIKCEIFVNEDNETVHIFTKE